MQVGFDTLLARRKMKPSGLEQLGIWASGLPLPRPSFSCEELSSPFFYSEKRT